MQAANNIKPLVSILMTSFNREKYIGAAIESVMALRYSEFELIIVDDCSTDDTVSIAKRYEMIDSRVRVFVNKQNLGDYPNRNKAASLAKGKYLKYLDSDDLIFPWGLDVMIECMETYPEAALGISQNNAYNIVYPKFFTPLQIYRLYFYKNILVSVGPTATIVRRDVFKNYGGFNGKRFVSDTDLWLRITQRYPLVLIPPGQVYWREHAEQQIVDERKDISIEAVRQGMHERLLDHLECPLSKQESQHIKRNLRNIKCRRILQNFLRGSVALAFARKEHLKLDAKDFFLALRKNKIPDRNLLEL